MGLAEPNSIDKDEKAPYIKGAMLIKNDKALTELDNDKFAGYRFLKCATMKQAVFTFTSSADKHETMIQERTADLTDEERAKVFKPM